MKMGGIAPPVIGLAKNLCLIVPEFALRSQTWYAWVMQPMTIWIEQIEFYAFHGATDEEQAIGHRYTLNLALHLQSDAVMTDRLDDTVDYGAASLLAVRVATESKHRLLEFVARRIADALLHAYPLLDSVDIELSKAHPPFPLVAASAGVQITVSRD